jgi:hypothetical protein
VRSIIKTGKRVERVDLYARLGVPQKEMIREVQRLVSRLPHSGMNYRQENLDQIVALVNQSQIDYYGIVYQVETIL